MRGKINRTAVAQLPLNTTLWSKEISGFGVRRQRRTPVFVLRKKGRQIVLGTWPVMSVDQARDAAIDRLRTNHIANGGSRFKDVVDLTSPQGNGDPSLAAPSNGTFSKTQSRWRSDASQKSIGKRSRTSFAASLNAAVLREIASAQRSRPSGHGLSLKARPT
jgi:hypothetical protein